jgi:hypothetical protein
LFKKVTITEESLQKAGKVIFLLTAQELNETLQIQIFSESRSGTIAHKNQKELQQAPTAKLLILSPCWSN